MAATPAVAIHQFAECITCHAWSPDQSNMFGHKKDLIGWISKVIRKRHESSVTSLAWHPNNQIAQLDLSSTWAFGVRWSASGKTLAYAGHNSMIYFVDEVELAPAAQNLALRDLPLRDVLFVSESVAIGVGFDCNPMIFAADDTGLWCIVPLTKGRDGTIKRFSTSGLDGKIVVWDLENHITIAK
nr:unnamed protein product [Digitaria exilis]